MKNFEMEEKALLHLLLYCFALGKTENGRGNWVIVTRVCYVLFKKIRQANCNLLDRK